MPSNRPLVLYELNEVPWRVVDHYVRKRPRSVLSELVSGSRTFTSHTCDVGELHPWTTWPTLHRGVYNTDHKIQFLNQDLSCASAYPPIWEVVARAGRKVGVFGSLQSFPRKPDLDYAFYVPDTFAPKPDTWPTRYSAFQRLNLRQTERDGGSPKAIKPDVETIRDLLSLVSIGLSARTIALLGKQVAMELVRPIYRTRRPIMQAPIAFDVFKRALADSNPDFATFFTNHVAGIMHRYWMHSFPEDFEFTPTGSADDFRAQSLIVALDIADRQIGYLKSFVDRRMGTLVVASSMGQEAIRREGNQGEVRVSDFIAFFRAIGFDLPVEARLAMQPDFNFACADDHGAQLFAEQVKMVTDLTGKPIFFRVQVAGNTVNCAIGCDLGWVKSEKIVVRPPDSPPRTVSFAAAGMKVIKRDIGTGYHQPEGIVIWYQRGIEPNSDRRRIESVAIAPMILSELGVR